MRKTCVLLLTLIITTLGVSAQKENSAGISFGYGSYVKGAGIGFRYQRMLNEHFRIAPAFAYYFKSNDRLGWETNIDVHYLIDIPATEDKCKIYPMVGATILSIGYRDHSEDRYNYSKNKFGGDIGAGIQYELFENFTVFGESKYLIISGADQFELAIGAALHF